MEPLSTTMTSSTNSGMARRTFSIPASSFRQGMMTVIDWPLYMRRPDFLAGQRRHNGTGDHEIDQAALDSSFPVGAAPGAAPTWRRAHRVRAAHGPRARAVPGQPADQRDTCSVIVTDPKMADAVSHRPHGRGAPAELDAMLAVPEKPEAEGRRQGERQGRPEEARGNSLFDPMNKLENRRRQFHRGPQPRARYSWWIRNRARWSGRYTSFPKTPRRRSWIA